MAGEAIVVMSVVLVSAIRGISNPLFVKSISSPAEVFGVEPVALIPMFWAFAKKAKKINKTLKNRVLACNVQRVHFA